MLSQPPTRRRITWSTSRMRNENSLRQPLHLSNCNLSFNGLLHNLPLRVGPLRVLQTQNGYYHKSECNVLGDFVADQPNRLSARGFTVQGLYV